MLLEKLLKEFNFSINTFNLEESKLFDRYFERILIGKDTFLIKEGEIERYSYFVYDGMLRCWLLNHKGEEQIFWFWNGFDMTLSEFFEGIPRVDPNT